MSNIANWTTDFSGGDEEDLRAGKWRIKEWNETIPLDDEGNPVDPPLPDGNNAQIAASYKLIHADNSAKTHANYIVQSAQADADDRNLKEQYQDANAGQRDAAEGCLNADDSQITQINAILGI